MLRIVSSQRHSILPEILEAPPAAVRCTARILNVAVPEVRLQRLRVDAVIGELVAAGMPEHMGMNLDA